MEMKDFLSRLNAVKNNGSEYIACCPAHDDKNPSLSVCLSSDGKKILFNCFAGCSTEAVLSSMGLNKADLFIDTAKKRVVSETPYSYVDCDGVLLYKKIRRDYSDGKKSFSFIQPDGTKGVKGIKRVPYNLQAVMDAETIYFVEGEKCADAVISKGCCATTLDSGARSKWLDEYANYFENKQVIIIPDNDRPGMDYAISIANKISGSVIKQLPELKEKEDIADWLNAGHSIAEIAQLPTYDIENDELGDEEEKKKLSQAGRMMKILDDKGAKPVLDSLNEPFVIINVNDNCEAMQLGSNDFNRLAEYLFYMETGTTIRRDCLLQAINILAAKARFESGEKLYLNTRVAEQNGEFFYDLSNGMKQSIKTSASGWEVCDRTPILFYRYRHQCKQDIPKKGGELEKIFDYVNVKKYRLLFLCWLISCFVPDIPHPMPIIYGEKGAAKSTACTLLKELIDPSEMDTLPLSNDHKNLIINLQQHWFIPFDNVSTIKGDCSDMLCRAITGDAIQIRRLFTNAEDVIFKFQRCIAINGISNVANRADLLDRSLMFELERVPEAARKELHEVRSSFAHERPLILGRVFDVLAKAMQIKPTVKLDKLPRMADFTCWGYAIAEAMGGLGEQFLSEYSSNRDIQNDEAINSDVVSVLIVELMRGRELWTGRVSALLVELKKIAEGQGISKNSSSIPPQPNALSRRIKSIKSNLESIGISYEIDQKRSDGTYITLHKEIPPLPPYVISPTSILGNIGGDSNGDKNEGMDISPLKNTLSANENGDSGDNGDNEDIDIELEF